MAIDQFSRTRLVYGYEGVDALQQARVAVFGLGGVGGFVAESLVRSGLGAIDIIDKDVVSLTNLNRQVIATQDTIGRPKTEVMAERLALINPACRVTTHHCFYLPATADEFDLSSYDYLVDAVDTVTAKLALIERAQRTHTPIISSMGAGNKTDPTAIRIADITKTSVCPLARIIRKELRRRGLAPIKVGYSIEPPRTPATLAPEDTELPDEGRRSVPGSNAFVPSAMGLAIGAEVMRDLIALAQR